MTILIAFIPLQLMGMTANIMSLGGIAVAIGAMVDAAIVVVEQTHKKLEHWEAGGRKEDYRRVVIDAVKEVGGPSFFALLVIAVSFTPVFALEAQEGRLFKPLALTKTLAMVIAALLAITLDPAMRLLLTRVKDFSFRPKWLAKAASALLVGKIRSEEEHPISKPMMKIYQPVVEFSLDHKWLPITVALLLMAVTIPVYNKLGSEFMPPLDEGTLLYMPTTTPGISVGEASVLLREQDRILHSFPQVQSVFGKAGRVESIRDENGRLSGYVFVDVAGRDLGSYVADAQRAVAGKVSVPTGYQLVWSGQYESIQRVRERLKMVLPVTLLAVFLLLYANTGSVAKTAIILLAVPFSGIGAIWLLHWMGYNMSVAVWVGLIALLGVDAETAVFMLLYLDLSCAEAAARGELTCWWQLRAAIEHGAVKRLRPKVMTVACMIFGLLPILWSNGAGADVMKRIAVPLVGGIITSFLMELVVYPPLFAIWKWNWEVKPAIGRAAELSAENLEPMRTTVDF